MTRFSRWLAPTTVVRAHCDLPCGVYDPEQARIEAESVLRIQEKYQSNADEVFRARDHLQKSGARIVSGGRRRAGCQVSVEFLDPDGHHLELYWGVDQIGYDGRSRPEAEWRQTMSLEDAVRIAPPGQDTTLHDKALADRIGAGTDRA